MKTLFSSKTNGDHFIILNRKLYNENEVIFIAKVYSTETVKNIYII